MSDRKQTTELQRLMASHPLMLNVCAMSTAFVAYFCMYAFRKPFAAGTYEGLNLWGTVVELKTAFVIFQILGYALAKYLGVKICPEVPRSRRAAMLVGLILAAELSLVLFALLPTNLKIVAIFLNGLALGMVWGLVVWYLEGRQTSEILLAVLSCSFIVSSGIVKDVGRALMRGFAPLGESGWLQLPPVAEFWMPAATGMLFFVPFLLAVWLLNQVPDPSDQDVRLRSLRKTMTTGERMDFVRRYFPGLAMLVLAYLLLTAFRDFRDNYTVEVLTELGYADRATTISSMETTIAFIVLAVMGMVFFIKDNRSAMLGIFLVIGFGIGLIGVATVLRQRGAIDGYRWMLAIGLGSYLAYVPYNSVLFDRMMASTRAVGTAVFAIYVADALGYTGSIVVQLFNDMIVGEMSRLEFLEGLSYFVSLVGVLCVGASGVYFWLLPVATEESASPESTSFGADSVAATLPAEN